MCDAAAVAPDVLPMCVSIMAMGQHVVCDCVGRADRAWLPPEWRTKTAGQLNMPYMSCHPLVAFELCVWCIIGTGCMHVMSQRHPCHLACFLSGGHQLRCVQSV
jgi:hypothetical protein